VRGSRFQRDATEMRLGRQKAALNLSQDTFVVLAKLLNELLSVLYIHRNSDTDGNVDTGRVYQKTFLTIVKKVFFAS
jgi:hypothetical protein